MIELTKLNGTTAYVNPDLIRYVESTPDTVLTFTDGQTLLVKNTPKQIVEKIVEFRRNCSSSNRFLDKEVQWTS